MLHAGGQKWQIWVDRGAGNMEERFKTLLCIYQTEMIQSRLKIGFKNPLTFKWKIITLSGSHLFSCVNRKTVHDGCVGKDGLGSDSWMTEVGGWLSQGG